MSELDRLRQENAQLKSLLKQNGIAWDETLSEKTFQQLPRESLPIPQTPQEKITLFRQIFQGRDDVFARRWESTKGISGYSPACGNEWKPGVCQKPKVKCNVCQQQSYLPVTDEEIFNHLSGKQTIGVYPLLIDNCCRFLAVDFDKAEWREDSQAFMSSCRDLGIPAVREISRSGNGSHVWIFFDQPVPARDARQLGSAIISYTCNRTRQLSLESYDRFFPSQDVLPSGGFGNLIALPLQRKRRDMGFSVFVDENDAPFLDQWDFLSKVRYLSKENLNKSIIRASDERHPLDIPSIASENNEEPWKQSKIISDIIPEPLPSSLTLVLANQIFIATAAIPQALVNRLIRLAAFSNPEFYKAQAMRLPVRKIPRIIGCAEVLPDYIGLPRGCLEDITNLLEINSVSAVIQDERSNGISIQATFTGTLRKDQRMAAKAIMKDDIGVLSAPTAFGKTVVAASVIAERKISTLVLVHRTELMEQWKLRLNEFLDMPEKLIGVYGGGRKKLNGKIDIAVMQSLLRREDLPEFLGGYGLIIVDECHHLSAFSFESILKQVKSRYILGLTATPIRRDGHHPIIFMQCGPIRHRAKKPQSSSVVLEVRSRYLNVPSIPSGASIQDVFRIIVEDEARNIRIGEDILSSYNNGRKVLVLTERTNHLTLLRDVIGDDTKYFFILHGRLSRKQRSLVLSKLGELDDSTPRIILATGRLIGEGFDHPPLDTLVLAHPISWKGTLQQYAGRLHRDHFLKKDVCIYDYAETDHPQLNRMWEKRLKGYKSMGYVIQ